MIRPYKFVNHSNAVMSTVKTMRNILTRSERREMLYALVGKSAHAITSFDLNSPNPEDELAYCGLQD